jgi:cytochrome P450
LLILRQAWYCCCLRGHIADYCDAICNTFDTSYDLPIQQIIGNIKLFFAAGTDTLGGVLSWVMYDVAKHQHVQAKLREEVITVAKGIVSTVHNLFGW